jgi:hypothetical protein
MIRIIAIVVLVLILLGHGGIIGAFVTGLLHTVAGFSLTTILIIVLLILIFRK